MTYARLFAAAHRYAAVYSERGVRSGDVIFIILRHCSDLFSSFLGAMLVGALPSFLPFLTSKQQPELYWAAHRALFSRTRARLLVTWPGNLAAMREAIPDFSMDVHLAEETPRKQQPATPIPERAASGPAFLQHSSGTTGLKKGVVITHEALATQIRTYSNALQLDQNDVIASWLPLYHDMGLIACFLMPAMLGVPVVTMDPFDWVLRPSLLLDAIEQYRATLTWLPNFAFHHLATCVPEGKRWDLRSVRAFISCSEPCKPETFRRFRERFEPMGVGPNQLLTCYALAENVFCATQSRPGATVRVLRADRAEFLSCGEPIEGVQARIIDSDGRVLPDRTVGEVALSGGSLFDGYYLNPEETSARLRDGWYWTGDLGFMHDNELFVTGRKDDLLIVHGINYYAHDVEYAASQVAGVAPGRCVAIGDSHPESGSTEVILLAEALEPDCFNAPELKRAIKERILSETGLLVQQVGIVPRGWLIKTTSGKISRIENLRRFRQSKQSHHDAQHTCRIAFEPSPGCHPAHIS